MGQGIKIIVFVVDFYNNVVVLCQLRKVVSKPQRVNFFSNLYTISLYYTNFTNIKFQNIVGKESVEANYSRDSIIRPGCLRLLGFKIEIVLVV